MYCFITTAILMTFYGTFLRIQKWLNLARQIFGVYGNVKITFEMTIYVTGSTNKHKNTQSQNTTLIPRICCYSINSVQVNKNMSENNTYLGKFLRIGKTVNI